MPLSKIRSIQSWFCWFFIGKGFITFSLPLSLVTDHLKEHTSLWKRSPGRNLRVLLTNKAETPIHGCHMSGWYGAHAYVDGLIKGLVLAYVRAPAYVYLAFSLFFPIWIRHAYEGPWALTEKETVVAFKRTHTIFSSFFIPAGIDRGR